VLYGIMLILCMMVMPLGLAGLVHTIRGLWRSRARSRTRS